MTENKSPSMALVCLFAVASAGACVAGAALPDLKPLPASEITRRFADVRLATAMADRTEIFHAGGQYELQGRAVIWGSYTIGDGLICVATPPGKRSCRRVLADERGNIYLSNQAKEDQAAPPWRVELISIK